ncbi:MAG: DMT family transporter, partial [Actinomycetota bacterium]
LVAGSIPAGPTGAFWLEQGMRVVGSGSPTDGSAGASLVGPFEETGSMPLVTLALIWGSSFLWIKIALRGLAPAPMTAVRLVLGALVLLAYARLHNVRLPRGPAVWRHLTVAAIVANVIPYFLFAYGEQQVDSAIAGILNAATPLWTVLIATTVGLERRPTARKLVGVVVGFGGAVLIFEPWSSGSQVMSRGGIACLVAAACYGVGYVYMTRFLAGRGLTPLALSAGQLVAASAASAAALPFVGWTGTVLRADAVAAVLILGVLGTGIAYVLNYRLISEGGASAASVVTYLIPVVAVLLGTLTLREALPLNVLAGMLVVLTGVALVRSESAAPAAASGP